MIRAYNRIFSLAEAIPYWLLALVARFGIGGVFWLSGRTKVDGWQVNDTAYALFADEYALPLIPSDRAAELAAVAEHLLPLLLAIGLLTRASAFMLLVMTAIIQVFVYPDAWPTHLGWAAILLLLVARGGGAVALDRPLGLR